MGKREDKLKANKKNREAMEKYKDSRNQKAMDAVGSAWDTLKGILAPEKKKKKKKPGAVPLNKEKVKKFHSNY